MMDQGLPPRVQDREEADGRAEMPRIGRNDPERLELAKYEKVVKATGAKVD